MSDSNVFRIASAAALALAVATAPAAGPYVGYIYPSGVQAGTTNRLVIGGQGFWGQLDAGVTGEGVKVIAVDRMALSAPPASSQHAWLKKWLDGIIVRNDPTRPALPTNATARVNEWTVNAWWNTLDQLDRRELEAVERDIYIRKNSLQMSPSLRQILFVDVVVDAHAKPGTRELCVWTQSGRMSRNPTTRRLIVRSPRCLSFPTSPSCWMVASCRARPTSSISSCARANTFRAT